MWMSPYRLDQYTKYLLRTAKSKQLQLTFKICYKIQN